MWRSRSREVAVSRRGAVVCERCRVADSPLSRMRGLLGRQELPAGEGIWLRPCGSVHTAFMRFAIDVVFLDREGRVVRVVRGLRPWRAAGARGSRSAIELPAGECERRGIAEGDVLAAAALA
jgi:uncharacterized membrane protein (UPF0127 family)